MEKAPTLSFLFEGGNTESQKRCKRELVTHSQSQVTQCADSISLRRWRQASILGLVWFSFCMPVFSLSLGDVVKNSKTISLWI